MRTNSLVLAVATLALAAGCASKDAPDDNGGPSRQGRLKEQTTATLTATETGTATHTSTSTGTTTQVVTATQTTTNTITATGTGTASVTQTLTASATATITQTATVTQTATQTVTSTATRTGTAPGTYQQIYTFTGTVTTTGTAIAYYTSWPHSQGNTATTTSRSFTFGTGVTTVTRTVTSSTNGTETKTASGTVSGSGTNTGTATVTVTATVTSSITNAGTGTRTVTATGTASGTAMQTWTATWTAQVTQTVTNTTTSTVTNTNTLTNTVTVTNTNTFTQTATQTTTASSTSTASSTHTATSTGTKTTTSTGTTTDTVTTTVTLTVTGTDTNTSIDGGIGGGSCLQRWRETTCGQWCLRETQHDRQACQAFLDCYLNNNCGPSTCGGPDQACGVNHDGTNGWGTAPKIIADQVYQCLGGPGSPPVTSCTGLPDTTPCTDGNACTTGDMCIGGACVPGTAAPCPGDQCNTGGTCNPTTGTCSKIPKPNGTTCDDGNPCTKDDQCSAGSCGGTTYTCDEGLACTAGTCNGDGTCTYSPKAGNCVIDGECYANGDTNPSNQCEQCTSSSSQTKWSFKTTGSGCEDGDLCTTGDTCRDGKCYAGPAPTCDDGNGDTLDYCDSTTGCQHLPIANSGANYGDIVPILNCVAVLPQVDAPPTYEAIFGYQNNTGGNVHIPLGADNVVDPAGATQPPVWILAGTQKGVMLQGLTAESSVSWTLNGTSVTATTNSQLCYINSSSGQVPVVTDGDGNTLFPLPDRPDQQPNESWSYPALAEQIVATETIPGTDHLTPGKTDGSFSVTDDGAATYRIPLWVPPGRAGVQPNLALVYSSSAGNGIMGMGWRIDGLSTITRCVQDWARDKNRRGISFDENDRLCLDGQRLVLYSGTWNRKNSEYRTEIDKYMKIVQIGEEQAEDGSIQPTGFLVYMPDGTIRSYGDSDGDAPSNFHGESSAKMAGKRVHLEASDQNQDPAQMTWISATLGWALATSGDRFGNQVRYYYHVHETAAVASVSMTVLDFRPDRILYTSSNTKQADREVHFYYDEGLTRADVREAFVGGLPLRTAHALTSIGMSGPAPTLTRNLRNYKFLYENYPQRLLLKTVSECDGDSVCKPATSFDWTTTPSTFVRKDTGLKDHVDFGLLDTSISNATAIVTGDFNGDGKDDIAYWRQIANVAWGQFHVREAKMIDFSGTFQGFGDEQLGFAPANDQWIRDGWAEYHAAFAAYNQTRAVDLNLDGKAELIVGQESAFKSVYSFSNCPTVETEYFTPNYCPYFLKADGSAFSPDSNSAGADCNTGWCEAEDCSGIFVKTCHYQVQNAPAGFYTDFTVDQDYNPYSQILYHASVPPMVGDFDGDGLPDLMRPYNFAAYPEYLGPIWAYRPNSNSGLSWDYIPIVESTQCGSNPTECVKKYSYHPDGWNTYVVDVDGDRKMELVFWDPNVPNNPTRLRVFKDASSGAAKTTLLGSQKQAGSIRYQFADVNGDGLQDAIEIPVNGGSIRLAYNTGAGFLPPVSIPLDDYSTFGVSGWASTRDTGARIVDFDMDGRADIFQLGNSCRTDNNTNARDGALVMQGAIGSSHGYGSSPLQTGSYLYQDNGSMIPIGDTFHGWGSWPSNAECGSGFNNSQVLDVNGDGLADILQVEGGSLYVYLRQGTARPGLLSQITDGLGNEVTVSYRPATDSTVHTPASSSDCAYPQYCVARGGWIVKNHVEAAGTPTATRRYSHQYRGARSDVTGIGWLGMDTHIVKEEGSGVTVTVNYDHKTTTGGIYAAREPVSREEAYPINDGQVATVYKVMLHQCEYEEATGPRVVATSCVDEQDRYEQKPANSGGTAPPPELVTRRKTTTALKKEYGYATGRVTEIGTSSDNTQNEIIGWSGDLFEQDDRDGSWLIGMVAHESTSHQMPPDPNRGLGVQKTVRDVHYLRDYNTGAVTTQILEPSLMSSQPNLYLRQDYARNGEGLVTKTTSWGWDAEGTLKKTVTATSYDPVSEMFPMVVTNALEQSALSIVHPGLGVELEMVDPNGLRTTRQFDKFGRLRGESRPDGTTTVKSYGRDLAKGWPLMVTTTVQGAIVTENFNQQGLKSDVLAVDFGGNAYVAQHYEYEPHGRVARSARPYSGTSYGNNFTSFVYDSLGRVTSETRPIGKTEYTYLGSSTTRRIAGSPLAGTDKTGDSVDVTVTDGAGRVSKRIETVGAIPTKPGDPVGTPRNITTLYYYGPFDLLTDVSPDVVGSQIHMEYDVRGRRTFLSDPDTGFWRDSFDSFGELTERKHMVGGSADAAADQTVKYYYDLLGRRTRETNRDGSSKFTWDAEPNGMGKLAATSSPEGADLVSEYDSQGRKSAEVLGVGGHWTTVGLGYDSQGRAAEIDYPAILGDRYKVYYDYNTASGNGALLGMRDTASGGAYLWQVTGRNLDGQILTEAFGDGSSGARVWEDERGLLKSVEVAASQPVETTSYTYDVRGYLATRSSYAGTTESFIHDELGRLRHWSNSDNSWYVHYDYDILGNMMERDRLLTDGTKETASFDNGAVTGVGPRVLTGMTVNSVVPGQTASEVITTFANDDLGRRTGTDTSGETVSFTDFDLPRSVTRPNETWGFKYDASHRRVVKDGPSGSILYHGSLYERRSTTGGSATHVMYVPGERGQAVAQVVVSDADSQRKTEYLHTDHLGSTTIVTAAGQAPTRVRFEPFGSRIDPGSPPAGAAGNPVPDVSIGFSGQEQEDDLGYVNMVGRIYDPSTARFLTADPFVTKPTKSQGLNRYSYANNSPLRFTDPSGFDGEEVAGDVVAPAVCEVPYSPEPMSSEQPSAQTDPSANMCTVPTPSADDGEGGGSLANPNGAGSTTKAPTQTMDLNGFYSLQPHQYVTNKGDMYSKLPWYSLLGLLNVFMIAESPAALSVVPQDVVPVGEATAAAGEIGAADVAIASAETGGATRGATTAEEAFHYTFNKAVSSIESQGLRAGSYATPNGALSPLQAQIDLALSPNRGLPDALMRIDIAGLRQAGYEIPEITQVGRSAGMPGGGFEMQFPYSIPPEFITVVRP